MGNLVAAVMARRCLMLEMSCVNGNATSSWCADEKICVFRSRIGKEKRSNSPKWHTFVEKEVRKTIVAIAVRKNSFLVHVIFPIRAN